MPRRLLLLVGVASFVLALNLRMGISSVGPVLPRVVHDLGAGLVYGSLLTTLPVVMMGLMSPWSARLAVRWGLEWSIVGALLVITVAVGLRLWTDNPWLLLVTALGLGAGIAAGNTILPAVVGTYFPAYTALMTGMYTVGMNIGAGAAAYGTPRLADQLSSTWRGGLAVWAIPALLAAGLWAIVALRVHRPPHALAAIRTSGRSRQVALVALLFGLQSMTYYGVLAWLAPLYEERGWAADRAGLLISILTGTQIVGSLAAAVVVQRTGRLVGGLRLAAVTFGAALLLVALTPTSAPWLWAVALGLGSGAIFTLALTVPLQVTDSVDAGRQLTSRMLCYGYLMAATGPLIVSVLRSASGGFVVAFLLLAGLCAAASMIARSVVHSAARLPSTPQ